MITGSYPHTSKNALLDPLISRVSYEDIAKQFGLDPDAQTEDMKTYPITYARIPEASLTRLFNDLQNMHCVYGPPAHHRYELVRSYAITGPVCADDHPSNLPQR